MVLHRRMQYLRGLGGSASLLQGLVSYYTFDAAPIGTVVVDDHGSFAGNTFGPSWGAGYAKLGAGGYNYTGSSWIEYGASGDFDDQVFSASIWAWKQNTAASWMTVLSHGSASPYHGWYVRQNSATAPAHWGIVITDAVTGVTSATSTVDIVHSTWYHLVITCSGTNAILYVDGVNTCNVNVPNGVDYHTGTFPRTGGVVDGTALPNGNNVQDWRGYGDCLGYWTRVLTQDDVTALYNGGAGLAYSSF